MADKCWKCGEPYLKEFSKKSSNFRFHNWCPRCYVDIRTYGMIYRALRTKSQKIKDEKSLLNPISDFKRFCRKIKQKKRGK